MMNEDQAAQATAQAVQSAAGHQTVADVQNAQLQALIQNAAAGGAHIVNSQGLTYNVLGAGATGVGAQIQNIQIDGQEAIFIPAALTGGATQVAQATGQIVRQAGGSPQTATAYQNVTIRNGNTIQTIQVPVAAPAVQQTTVVPMQVPVPTANGQTLYQTIHVPIQSIGGCGVGGLGLGGVTAGVGMGGVAQVAGMLAHGQPVALQQLAGLTAAPQAHIAQIQVQQPQSSPTTPNSVGATVSAANGGSAAANQAQAVQTVASVAGVQPVTQVQQVANVQSMQQWAADAAALAQAQAQAAQVAVHQQHQTVALQLPNGQIVQGQHVNLAGGATMVYPGGGGMNMAAAAQLAAAGLRSPGVIQLANLNGVPVQIQGGAGQQQLQQLLQGNAALQALGLQTAGPLSPLQTIQIAGATGAGQQTIVSQHLQQDPNDPTRWQIVNVPQTVTQAQAAAATHVAVSQAATAAVTPTTVTVQATPQHLQVATTAATNAATVVNGDAVAAGAAAAAGAENAPQQIVLVATGGGEVVTASAATAVANAATAGNGASGGTATIAPVTSATGTPLATGERRLRRVACTCPNCRDGDGHRTIRPNGEGPGRRQHICHIAGCHKVYGKTSHLRAHLRWHAGERPFVCDWLFCGKGFTRSDELQRHKRTHTGEKRFQCAECRKGFMRSDHLSKHLKTHLASRNGLTFEGGDSDMETIDHMDANGNGVVEANGGGAASATGGHTSIVTLNADGTTETTTVPVGQAVQVAGSVTISGAMGVTAHDVGTAGPTATIMHVVKHEDGQPLQISDGTRIHDVVQIRAEDGTTQLQIVQTTAA